MTDRKTDRFVFLSWSVCLRRGKPDPPLEPLLDLLFPCWTPWCCCFILRLSLLMFLFVPLFFTFVYVLCTFVLIIFLHLSVTSLFLIIHLSLPSCMFLSPYLYLCIIPQFILLLLVHRFALLYFPFFNFSSSMPLSLFRVWLFSYRYFHSPVCSIVLLPFPSPFSSTLHLCLYPSYVPLGSSSFLISALIPPVLFYSIHRFASLFLFILLSFISPSYIPVGSCVTTQTASIYSRRHRRS